MKHASALSSKLFPVIKSAAAASAVIAASLVISACSAEVGSERWCKNMEEKPKGDWSVNEAKDYAQHCVFK